MLLANLNVLLFWALGRGVKWNEWFGGGKCYENLPEFVKIHPKFIRGREEGWILDFSPRPSTDFYKHQKYKDLYLYAVPYEYNIYR